MKFNYKTTTQLDTNFVPDLKVNFITKLIGDDQIYPHQESLKAYTLRALGSSLPERILLRITSAL